MIGIAGNRSGVFHIDEAFSPLAENCVIIAACVSWNRAAIIKIQTPAIQRRQIKRLAGRRFNGTAIVNAYVNFSAGGIGVVDDYSAAGQRRYLTAIYDRHFNFLSCRTISDFQTFNAPCIVNQRRRAGAVIYVQRPD